MVELIEETPYRYRIDGSVQRRLRGRRRAGRELRRHHVGAVPADHRRSSAGDTDEDRLAAVLDEVTDVLDTEDVVPVGVEVETPPGRAQLRLAVTPTHAVELVGAAPKAVTLSGLRLIAERGRWHATATIDAKTGASPCSRR